MPALVWLSGFTVDDALISARVAHQLALGNGYRFNPGGPIVDAVTPLGFALLLAPFAAAGPLQALAAAKILGALAWLGAASWLGRELARLGRLALVVGLALLAACTPLAVWAVSGMETGLVTLLATLALTRSRAAPLAAGLAAGLRPELGPWAVVLVLGRALHEPGALLNAGRERWTRAGLSLAVCVAPVIAVAAVRTALFGHAYPLSVLAKPSDVAHGIRYAVGAALYTGPLWLLATRLRTYRAASARARVCVLAAAAHWTALVLAGGDWMPLFRLAVPVLPSLILAGSELVVLTEGWLARAPRVLAAIGVASYLGASLGPSSARVGVQRRLLIERAAPLLEDARRVGALDVGWVGAATSATVVDFAGVTDPSIARLPGGHTTKRLPEGFLETRSIDALVVLARDPRPVPLAELDAARGVEARLASLAGAEDFTPVGLLPLLGTELGYVVYRRLGARLASGRLSPGFLGRE